MDAYDLFLKRKQDVKFYDGDTAYGVEGDTEDRSSDSGLRIQGINTPEAGMAGSDAALELAREYETDSRTVFGEDDVFSEKGYFGRRLGDRLNESTGKRLSHELLRQGLATPGNTATDQQTAIYDSFLAKNNGLGLNAPTQEEAEAYDRFQMNQAAQIHDLRGRDNPYEGTRGEFHTDALERGTDQVQQMGYGFAKVIGEVVGSEDMEEWAQRGIDVNTLEMFLNPRQTRSFTEAEGIGESIASLYESVIEQAPNIGVTLAASIASGGIGGLVGRNVASKIAAGEIAATTTTQNIFKNAMQNTVWSGSGKQALNRKVRQELGFGKRGAQIGAGTASVGMNTGETKLTFDREGIDDNGLALFVGGVKGALDFAGLANIPGVNRLIGMGIRQSGKNVTRAQLFKQVPFKVLKAATIEGSTEALQQVADIVAVNTKKNRAWSDADTDSVIEALAVGAAAGKAFATPGAVGSAAFTPIQQEQAKEQAKALGMPTEQLEMDFGDTAPVPPQQQELDLQPPPEQQEMDFEQPAQGELDLEVPQTVEESPRDIDTQIEAYRTGKRKQPVFKATEEVPDLKGRKAIVNSKPENGLYKVAVDDGKQKGIAYFKTRKEALAYRNKVRARSVENANEVTLPDGGIPKSQVIQESQEAGTQPLVVMAANVMEDGSIHSVIHDTLTTEARRDEAMAKMQKQYPDATVMHTTAEEAIADRQRRTQEVKDEATQRKAEIADNTIGETEGTGLSPEAFDSGTPTSPSGVDSGLTTDSRTSDVKIEVRTQNESIGLPNTKLSVEGQKEADKASKKPTKTPKAKSSKKTEDKAVKKAKKAKPKTRKPSEDEKTGTVSDPDNAPLDKEEGGAFVAEEATEKEAAKDKAAAEETVIDEERDSTQEEYVSEDERVVPYEEPNKVRLSRALREIDKRIRKRLEGIKSGYLVMTPAQLNKLFDLLPPEIAAVYKKLFVPADGKTKIIVSNSTKHKDRGGYFAGKKKIMAWAKNNKEGETLPVTLLHEIVHSNTIFFATIADALVSLGKKAGKNVSITEVLDGLSTGDVKGLTQEQAAVFAEAADKGLLDKKGRKLVRELINHYAEFMDAKPKIPGDSSFTPTITEFIAEVLSDPRIMREAAKIKSGKKLSVFQRIINSIASFFGAKKASLLNDILSNYSQMVEMVGEAPSLDGTTVDNLVKAEFDKSYSPRAQQPFNRISKAVKDVMEGERVAKLTDRTKKILLGAATPFRSSLARLAQISPALANRYKSRRGAAKNKEGYLDKFAADESQWKARYVEEVMADATEAEMAKAYEDFINGKRDTAITKRMAEFFNDYAKYLSTSSVPHIAALGKASLNSGIPYFPQIHDRGVIREDVKGYLNFLLKGNNGKAFKYTTEDGSQVPITDSVARSIVKSMLTDSDLEGTLRPEASSMHRRVITDPAYQAAALKAGWLNKDPRAVIEMYVKTMTRQKAFEETFGGWVEHGKANIADQLVNLGYTEARNKNSNSLTELTKEAIKRGQIKWQGDVNNLKGTFEVWAPAKQRTIALANIERRKGRKARQEAELAMNAMDGIIGLDINEDVRGTMQWLAVAQSYMLLAFSTITSLPEFGVMMAGLVGKSPSAAWKGMKKFAKDVGDVGSQINQGKSFKQIKNESMAMARVLGTIPDALTATGFVDSSLFEATGNMPRIAMEKLFTYNGNILFNNALRSIATNVGIDYFMEKSNLAIKGDKQAKADLKRWGVNPQQFTEWVGAGKPAFTKNGNTNPVSKSLLNFVDAHVARPTSDTKAVFGNDPRFMLIAQLKSFFYAYGRDIIPELVRTMGQRYANSRAADRGQTLAALNSLFPAAVIGALALPLGMAADAIKQEIKSLSDDEYEDRLARYQATMSNTDKAVDIVRSSGILGPIDLLMSFHDAQERDGSGLARALGPTASHIDTLWTYGPFSPEFAKRTTPLAGTLVPGVYQEWLEEARKERRAEKRKAQENK